MASKGHFFHLLQKRRGDGVRRASKEAKPGSSQTLAPRNPRWKAKHAQAVRIKTLAKCKPASHDGRAAQPATSQSGDSADAAISGKQPGQEETLATQEPSSKDDQANTSTPPQGLPRVQEGRARRTICLLSCGHVGSAHRGSLAESPETSVEACVTPDSGPGISEMSTSWGTQELPRPLVELTLKMLLGAARWQYPCPTRRRVLGQQPPTAIPHPAGLIHCRGAWQGGIGACIPFQSENLRQRPTLARGAQNKEAATSEKQPVQAEITGKNSAAWCNIQNLLYSLLKMILKAVLWHFPRPTRSTDWALWPPSSPPGPGH